MKNNPPSVGSLLHTAARLLAISSVSAAVISPVPSLLAANPDVVAVANGEIVQPRNLTQETHFQLANALNFNASAQAISGKGPLVLLGGTLGNGGTLTLTDVNTYTGATVINGATLRLGANATLGGTTGVYKGTFSIAENATLDIAQTVDQFFTGAISGTGVFTKTGTGRLALSGNNSGFTGTFTVTKGTLAANSANALSKGNITLNGATLELNGANKAIYNNALTIGSAGATLALATPNATAATVIGYSGTISGTGRLTKTGLQRLELSGTISAPFTLSEGTLGGTGTITTPTFEAGTTLSPGTATGIGILHLGVAPDTKPTANVATFKDLNFEINATAAGASDRIATVGSATFSTGNTVAFSAAASTREYVILTATGKINAAADALASTTFLWGAETVDNATRKKAVLKVVDAVLPATADPGTVPGQNLVLATYTSASLRLQWNGTTANDLVFVKGDRTAGDPAVANSWKETGVATNAVRWFQNGDVVEFGDFAKAKKTLEVSETAGVIVGGLTVTGKNYIFNGYKILGSLTETRSPDFAATGALEIAEGASATFNNPIEFRGGIKVAGDVTFNNLVVTTPKNAAIVPLTIAETGTVTATNGAIFEVTNGARLPSIENDGKLIFKRDTGSDFTLKAALSGAGEIEKRGTGKLTLAGTANTTTGKLTVFEGTLAYNKDVNLGTGENILNGGTLAIAAGTYNKPWTLDGKGGTFAIASGNVRFAQAILTNIDPDTGEKTTSLNPDGPFGILSGTGALTKTGAGNLYFDNGAQYTGATTVLGGNIFATGNLGTDGTYAANITLDGGNFQLTNTADQTLSGAILGTAQRDADGNLVKDPETERPLHPGGTFTKRGTGTLTLAGATPKRNVLAFNNVEGATVSESLITAETFTNGVKTTTTARPAETAPTAQFTGTALTVGTLTNHTDSVLTAATVTASVKIDNAGDYHVITTKGTLNNTASGRIYLDHADGAQNTVIETLNNTGNLYYDTAASRQRLTLTNLSGKGRINNYHLDNFTPANSSVLEIKGGTLTGAHTLQITLPNDPAHPETSGFGEVTKNYTRQLIQYTSGGKIDPSATVRLVGPDGRPLEAGLYRLDVAGTGNSLLKVVAYSALGNSLVASTAAVPLAWFSQLDNVSKRFGELRCGTFAPKTDRDPNERLAQYELRRDHTAAADSEFSVWLRGYGSQTNVDLSTDGIATFKEFQYGGDVGTDLVFAPNANNRLFLGLFVGFQGSRRNIDDDSGSTNFTRSVLGGVYLNWVNKDGWYGSVILKGQNFFNETRAGLDRIKNDYTNAGFGGAIEFGKQITFAERWFVEPSAQIEYLSLLSKGFTTKRTETQSAYKVTIGSATGIRLAAHVRAGTNIDLQTNGVFQPYIRIGGDFQFTDGGEITAGVGQRSTIAPNYDDWHFRAAVGAAWQITNNIGIHAEYETAKGDKTNIPWAVNAGLRLRF